MRTSRMRAADVEWPNLFIVGAGRCGTTSLWRLLGEHPDIFMSPVKEPHFFAPGRTRYGVVKSRDAYLRLFADAGTARLRGEASVSYFWDEASPAAIRDASPEARIVISLRDPVRRAYSSYWHMVRWGLEPRTFRAAVADELGGRDAAWYRGVHPGYLRGGLYSPAVRRYTETFADRVFVLFFDEALVDPSPLRALYAFLDVEAPAGEALALPRANVGRVPRSRQAWRILHAVPAVPVPVRLRRLARGRLERLGLARSIPTLDDDVRRALEEYFESDRQPLERLLGRAVPW